MSMLRKPFCSGLFYWMRLELDVFLSFPFLDCDCGDLTAGDIGSPVFSSSHILCHLVSTSAGCLPVESRAELTLFCGACFTAWTGLYNEDVYPYKRIYCCCVKREPL
ncbi:hypothetical protein J4Q44_G00252060 [Coregonus suidteri]|uniref:Uncharacterized protein n=1 Tax=Coregonus suidteri TaxID=861788 RepID=A0AAN8L8M9_9TELE